MIDTRFEDVRAELATAWARIAKLEAVADAARVVVDNEGGCASGGWREGAAFLALADALDACNEVRNGYTA